MRKTLLVSTALLFALGAAGSALAQAQVETQGETRSEAAAESRTGSDLRTEVEAAAEAAAETAEGIAEDIRTGLEDAAETLDATLDDDDAVTAAQPAGTLLSNDLRGRPVQNFEGEDLATLDNFVITPDGEVTHAVVSFGGFLGFGKKQAMIAWSEFEVDEAEGVLRLRMEREQIAELPAFRARAQVEAEAEPLQQD